MKEIRELFIWISGFKVWNWSWMRWFGIALGIGSLILIGYFSSYWVSLGLFLWSWASNIDRSDL